MMSSVLVGGVLALLGWLLLDVLEEGVEDRLALCL